MSKIEAKIIADSLSPQGDRLTTFVVTFPRIILAEFNTHRMFSRNSASSRAIPFAKMVESVETNPFIPIAWQKDHKGMQGSEYLTLPKNNGDIAETTMAISTWLSARDYAIKAAQALHSSDNGYSSVTKQLCNRLLEPFMWHTVIITSGKEGLDNFFDLRCPKLYHAASDKTYNSLKDWNSVDTEIQWDGLSCMHPENTSGAEIHIQALAEAMWDAMNESTPKQLKAGEWHIPFGDQIEGIDFSFHNTSDIQWTVKYNRLFDGDSIAIKIAVARCARISYTVVGEKSKEPNYENDIKLHDRLVESNHWSPAEHCARVMTDDEYKSYWKSSANQRFKDKQDLIKVEGGWCRNFKGFIQYRELIS
jgi:hypothetical protein